MRFKTFELIVGGATLTLQDVQQIHENKQSNFLNNSDLYLIESEIIEERFLWLYCQYNNTELYNSTVWNNSTNTKEHNPRKKNQIECRYQLFICYDIEKSFYI